MDVRVGEQQGVERRRRRRTARSNRESRTRLEHSTGSGIHRKLIRRQKIQTKYWSVHAGQ